MSVGRAAGVAVGIAVLLGPSAAYAGTTHASVSQARPRAGAWRYVQSAFLGVKPTTRVNAARTRVKNVSVVPVKGSGCSAKRLTVPGSFLIRKGGDPGDTWYVGDPKSSDGNVHVKVKQGKKRYAGEVYYDFTSPTRGRGNVIVDRKNGSTLCDLYFELRAPAR